MANLGASWSHFLAVTDDHGVNAAIGVQNTSGKSGGKLVTLFCDFCDFNDGVSAAISSFSTF